MSEEVRSGWVTRILAAERVPTRTRLILSLVLALVGGGVTLQKNIVLPIPRDVDQVWFAARSVLNGLDPYQLIGPGRAFEWPAPFFYPLPAALIMIPLAPFPETVASVLFSAIAGGCFAWALLAYGYAPLFGFMSASVHFAFELAQWSPLLSAAVVLGPVAAILVAKPTVGLAMFIARPTRWAVIGAFVLTVLSFMVQPGWLLSWREVLKQASFVVDQRIPYVAPVTLPGGVFALPAWPDGGGRGSTGRGTGVRAADVDALYETVPLFLVPRTFQETTLLVALSYIVLHYLEFRMPGGGYIHEYVDLSGRMIVLFLYLPVTVMVLRRPNEGSLPEWIESRIARWPIWLRGRSAAERTRQNDVARGVIRG